MERDLKNKTLCEPLPLKWRSFRERSKFPRIWFRDLKFRINLRSRNQASESTQLFVTRVFFFSLISRNYDNRFSSKVCCIMLCLRYTKWEDLSLIIIVSTVFNNYIHTKSATTFWEKIFKGYVVSWIKNSQTVPNQR